jgi:hypothetical protein
MATQASAEVHRANEHFEGKEFQSKVSQAMSRHNYITPSHFAQIFLQYPNTPF